uniref:Uncharacterized protein n=1 Tax=Sexangularia sp. CB-2014 TaxID=1486929 RepID=A0A6U0IAW9_9EUKA|mmetsp:Transcript_13585/g.42754  ORF Transcript_13585/g.42754 Transcript_13585/m.42754 type:complete len:100 (+) Transcript_13585:52-351(+)|eukprot:CAMPEP_0170745678 /NCGR_PEP_ID=MMETSP0437-20130122/8415_1 /TAXON_ID=0 /ORGANISM="Sexangularia sp." /LENGTH=99 /DNA_ID=CAMNT_0011084401 /DNA_START=40 /DNA_END=339 /DNA_ORIENTATION=-
MPEHEVFSKTSSLPFVVPIGLTLIIYAAVQGIIPPSPMLCVPSPGSTSLLTHWDTSSPACAGFGAFFVVMLAIYVGSAVSVIWSVLQHDDELVKAKKTA